MSREIAFDVSNEQVLIRTAIADAGHRKALVHKLSDSEFLNQAHSAIWRAMRALVDKALDYAPATLRTLLINERENFDDEYLAELEAEAAVANNLDWHVTNLRWDATRARTLKEALPALVKELESAATTPDQATAAARGVLRALEAGGGRRHIHRPHELSRAYKAEIRNRMQVGNFYPTGFTAMDCKLTEGMMPRRTTVVTGLPNSGKSTFAAHLGLGLAKQGRRVLMGCWEMPAKSLLDVMTCAMTGVELMPLVQGKLNSADLKRVERAADWITARMKFMDNAFFTEQPTKGKRSNDRNLDILEGYVAESGCDVMIMDLWERALVDLSPDAVALALNRQQAMHVEYACHGVIVQQLRLKDVERRADKRPTRDAIKGSAAYVEVADLIFGIHRDAQFKAVPDDAIEAICLKQRKGVPNWAVRFGWNGARCAITGGVEVSYDPGLESVGDVGEVGDIGGIRVKPRQQQPKPGRRDN